MKFIVHWTQMQSTFKPAVDRFLKEGAQPPAGVTLLGRWFGMNGTGFQVVETTDAKALFTYATQRSDVLHIEATPLVEDAQAGEVMASLYG
ncbi:MAG: hypothetical protein JWR32_3475 [Mycobacterium sp.]|jgi:hypothetical protein|nr:hypothetical protein [Mycobacterium sp.]